MALGEILKQKRLERNFTKEYIAERTHMMVSTIDALEGEDFTKIPAAIYGRGFIKTYCKVLDINPQPLIDEYMTHVDGNYARLKPKAPPAEKKLKPVAAPVHTGQHTVHPPKDMHRTMTALPRLVSAGASNLRPAQPQVSPEPPVLQTMHSEMPSPPPAQKNEENFALEGDVVPPPTTEVKRPRSSYVPAPEEPSKFHRLVSAKDARETRVEPTHPLIEEEPPSNTIFAPHRPAATPTSPIVKLLQASWVAIKNGCLSAKQRISSMRTNSKIRRIDANEERPLLSRQHLVRIATIFGVLISLTLIFLLFRWVFNESSDYVAPTTTTAEELPLLTPPEPFFS
ncbi:MAG: helix-turn-helix domain-containing protein [bacterium]|nr:helix-turn-helix domain-containing protein [bacterium]